MQVAKSGVVNKKTASRKISKSIKKKFNLSDQLKVDCIKKLYLVFHFFFTKYSFISKL